MHTDTPPYDNNDVRLALKYAIDREQLVEKVLNNTGSVGNDHPISPANAYFNTELPQRVYDPDKARFHLEKAGMTDLRVELSTSEAIWEGAVDAAIIYSESAAKAGITLEVNKVPNDGYWSNVWLKHPSARPTGAGVRPRTGCSPWPTRPRPTGTRAAGSTPASRAAASGPGRAR